MRPYLQHVLPEDDGARASRGKREEERVEARIEIPSRIDVQGWSWILTDIHRYLKIFIDIYRYL